VIKRRDYSMKTGTWRCRVQVFYDVWQDFYQQLSNLQVGRSYQYKSQIINTHKVAKERTGNIVSEKRPAEEFFGLWNSNA